MGESGDVFCRSRYGKEPMRKKIKIDELSVGMYVCGLDRSWLHTPFFFHSFLVKNCEQIRKIRESGIEYVEIDVQKGAEVKDTLSGEESRHEFIALPLASMKINSNLPCDLYIDRDGEKVIFMNRNMIFSSSSLEVIKSLNIPTVFIASREEGSFAAYLKEAQYASEEKPYTKKDFTRYNELKEAHYPIARELLIPHTKLNFSLFHKFGFSLEPIVLVDQDQEVLLSELLTACPGEIVIRNRDIPKYREYLSTTLKTLPGTGPVKAKIARENAQLTIKDLLQSPRGGKIIDRTKEVVEEMIDIIFQEKGAFAGILTLNTFDHYTYSHSVNVATLAIALGKTLGFEKSLLFETGIGAILHDIGKSRVPSEILNKPGRLSGKEYQLAKQHVLHGRDILMEKNRISDKAMTLVMEHHEKQSGVGYPYGLKGEEISLAGRMASIIDVYDALTAERPYRQAYPPFYALSFIGQNILDFDREIYRQFVTMLGNPV
jgi:putative nucleotidyltransferase with HDIG domain